jgi:tetratricopeptide (TPR) repeat protein
MAGRSAHNLKFSRGYYSRLKSQRAVDHTDYVLAALRDAKTPEDRWDIRHTLIGELVRVGRLKEAEKLLLEDVDAEPNNPLPLMSLATHYHYSDRLPEAKSYIRRAVTVAKRTRTLAYGTLGQQARVAISAKDWRLLARTLRDMTAYRHKTGNADCFPEADFLARIPPGAVPDSVIAAFQRRRAYLSAIRYSTLYGRGGQAPSNSSVQPTRKKPRAADRRR